MQNQPRLPGRKEESTDVAPSIDAYQAVASSALKRSDSKRSKRGVEGPGDVTKKTDGAECELGVQIRPQ